MTNLQYLESRRRDIEEKMVRNGVTAGLMVQKREVMKKIKALTPEEAKKEYVEKPRAPKPGDYFQCGY